MIGQCRNFHCINSAVEISRDICRILADYCLRHLVNNVAIHIYIHDYIWMEITVLYFKISQHQLSIEWSPIDAMKLSNTIQLSPNSCPVYGFNQISIFWEKIYFSFSHMFYNVCSMFICLYKLCSIMYFWLTPKKITFYKRPSKAYSSQTCFLEDH